MKYDVLLVGLGGIGLGKGIYKQDYNNHLYSLYRSAWVQKIFVIDPNVDCNSLINEKIRSFNENDVNFENKRLYVDSGPMKGRLDRLFYYYEIFKPTDIFLEKPVDYNAFNNIKKEIINNSKINYFRRTLSSSEFLKRFLYKKINKVSFYFNNGLFNDGSHFIDFLDFFGFDIKSFFTSVFDKNGNSIKISNNVELIETNEKNKRFDIIFYANNIIVKYLNYGKIIELSKGETLRPDELSCRFKNIYFEKLNLKKLTCMKKDILYYKVLLKLNEEFYGKSKKV